MPITEGTDILLARTGLPVVPPGPNFPDPGKAIHINGSYRASIARTLANAGGAFPTTGRLFLVAVTLYAGEIVNGLSFCSQNASTNLTHSWAALYDGSKNLLGVSADNTAAWATQTVRRFALNSAYTVPNDGTYYAGLCKVATTDVGTTAVTLAILGNLSTVEPRLAFMAGTGLTTPSSAPAIATVGTAVNQVPFVAID